LRATPTPALHSGGHWSVVEFWVATRKQGTGGGLRVGLPQLVLLGLRQVLPSMTSFARLAKDHPHSLSLRG
jgi:hypothetical protein